MNIPTFNATEAVTITRSSTIYNNDHSNQFNIRGLHKCKRGKERCCQRGLARHCCVPREMKCRHVTDKDCTRNCF